VSSSERRCARYRPTNKLVLRTVFQDPSDTNKVLYLYFSVVRSIYRTRRYMYDLVATKNYR